MNAPLPDTRPTGACLTCRPPTADQDWRLADDGYRTCEKCLSNIRQVISDIRTFYQRLDPTPGSMGESGSRGSPGFGSKPTVSLHIVAMRDRRSMAYEVARDGVEYTWVEDPRGWSPGLPEGVEGPLRAPGGFVKREVWYGSDGRGHSEQSRPPRSIPKTIESLAQWVAEDREMTTPTGTVDELCCWIDNQLDHVTRQDWVGDFDAELRSLRAQLKPVAGEGQKNKILSCPSNIGDGEHIRICGANLYEPDRAGVIRCHACKHEWARDKWIGDGPEFLKQKRIAGLPSCAA